MNNIDKNSLVDFYFGSLPEEKRLLVEKEMLLDPEVLLDYLDLKRELEASKLVPQQPSRLLWQRLSQVPQNRKAWYITFAVGALAAAMAYIFVFRSPVVETSLPVQSGAILFDSSSEHLFTSDVL